MADSEAKDRNVRLALYALFFVSGTAALVYQTVWIRKFSLVLGGTVNSMSIVVSTFMAGLAVGAAVLGRLSDRVKRPLVLYAGLELSIAALAIVLDRTDGARARMTQALIDAPDLPGTMAMRTLIAVAWLGPPCFLMGGTLPVMVKHIVRRLASVGGDVGALYFVNTLGAAVGALSTGLFLVEALGLSGSTFAAAAINVVVGLAALRIGSAAGPVSAEVSPEPAAAPVGGPRWPRITAAVVFFVCGFCSLVLELSWTRLVLGFLDAGAMVISINLFLVLLGFALGGALVARFADRASAPRALASGLLAAAAAVSLAGLGTVEVFTYDPTSGYWPSTTQLFTMLGLVLPASVLMGAVFPMLVKLLVSSKEHLGQQLGGYYALNTLGTVIGGLATPFILIPSFGVSHSILIAAGLQLVGAGLLLAQRPLPRGLALYAPVGAMGLALVLALPNQDAYREAIQRASELKYPHWSVPRAYVEGADSTVILWEVDQLGYSVPNDVNQFRVQVNSSLVVAFDTDETKLMAHLPLLAAASPKRALVICFGMGNTFRSALSHGIDVDVVDINAAIPGLARIHQKDPARTFENPRGHIYINDGRNFLLLTRNTYDMITIDPAPPTYGLGLGNIQSQEFYQLISDRLTDTGVAEAWMLAHLEGDFERTLAAFRKVFPYVAVFRGARYKAFHVLGSRAPIRFSRAKLATLSSDPALAADLGPAGRLFTPDFLASLYVTDESGVDQIVAGTPPLVDDRPELEYRSRRGLIPSNPDVSKAPKKSLPLDP